MMLLNWARVWSPVVPTEWVHAAWRELALPGDPARLEPEFLGAFHYGAPAPLAPLILHHTLNLPGDSTREDWMRVIAWLDLQYGDIRLPPDHLAVACEAVAVARERDENVIVDELLRRYILPWCSIATEKLIAAQSAMAALPQRFAADLR
jgi:hypothetical protein